MAELIKKSVATPPGDDPLFYVMSDETVDRMGDVIEAKGWKLDNFIKNPIALFGHDHTFVIGHWTNVKVQAGKLVGRLHLLPAGVSERLDEIRAAVEAGVLRAVSVGFTADHKSIEPMKSGGIRFRAAELMECSLVSVPANPNALQMAKALNLSSEARALIFSDKTSEVRSIARSEMAASGLSDDAHAASGDQPKHASRRVKPMARKSYADQISAFKDTRAEKAARMDEIMDEAEGQTLDEAQRAEFDELQADIGQIDEHVKRLRALEKAQMETLRPVDGGNEEKSADTRSGIIHAKPKVNIEKGTGFTRYAMALAAGRGSVSDALKYVEARQKWMDETPEVAMFIKADPGTTTDATWAAPLVQPNNLAAEFIELLRPATILGRIEGVRRVPFNVRIPVQTGGSTVNWVGEAAPKPVSELAFDAITLGMNKVAGIVVLTDELVRSSSPAAEATVRNDLVAQIARFLDGQFIDPAKAAAADSPASITNGVAPIAASGTDAEALYWDLNSALAAFDDTDLGSGGITLVMRPGTARGISSLRNALGQFEFGGVNMAGGTLNGSTVITSNSVPAGVVILIKGDEILLADDGQTALDASREATLDMNGGTTPNFNLFQRNAVAIRAERYMTWRKRRADAVAVITGAAYGPAAPVVGP